MKNVTRILSLLLAMGYIAFMTSCSDDEGDTPIIITDDGNGGGDSGLNVSDGFYVVKVGADTTVLDGMVLSDTKSTGEELNVPLERPGFKTVYTYLEAGDYVFAEIEDGAIASALGGEVTSVDSAGAVADGYDIVATAANGAAFNIGETGVYHVAHDETTSKAYIFKVDRWGILGTSLEFGFNEDFDMNVTESSSTGTTWVGEGITIRPGTIKVRYNDTWNLFTEDEFDIFTNFGGSSVDALEPGAGDIPFDGEGVYTVTLALDEFGGFTLDLNRTGDAEELTFDPADYNFGIIGDATANGWDADRDMFYKGKSEEGVYTWYGVVTLIETGNIKFRTNDDWTFNLGGELPADGSVNTLATGGSDIPTPGAGAFYVTLQTADEGETWTASMVQNGWGIIGNGTPTGWDADTDMTVDGFEGGITTYSINIDILASGEYKFRAADDWAYNLGGDAADLEEDGGNLAVAEDGNYDVVLSYDGAVYSTTATRVGDASGGGGGAGEFDPAAYDWAVIGDATANGWDADMDMVYQGESEGVHTWATVVTLGETGEFKFRINDAWDYDLGGTIAADGSSSTLEVGGGDFANPGAGAYYIELKTADEGETWTATMVANGWGIIGEATPTGWDADTDLMVDGFEGGVTTYSITIDMTAAEYKFRANDDWVLDLGGDMADLSDGGDNLVISEAGTYDIVLSYDGNTYSMTATKQ